MIHLLSDFKKRRQAKKSLRQNKAFLYEHLAAVLTTLQSRGGLERQHLELQQFRDGLLRDVREHGGALQRLIDECRHLNFKLNALYEPRSAEGLFRAVQEVSQAQTVEIIRAEMSDAVCVLDHRAFLTYALTFATGGAVLEFGVYAGTTINWMSNDHPARQFYGFDTFLGLPGSWAGYEHFDFNRNGEPPAVGSNVELIKGLFGDTIPIFLTKEQDVAVVHVDCDLYSSTVSIFDGLGPSLKSGCVLIFDEYFNYPNFEHHERKALQEFLERTNTRIRWIAYSGQRAAGVLMR